jgi:transcription initiation factor IIE alpha subunit
MPQAVKIKKAGTKRDVNYLTDNQVARAERQRDNRTAHTIKGWVAELKERKNALRTSANRVIRTLEST